jgi:hypothetical protein
MPTTLLTSWKEIAQHLGKGVRTVQRWEHELGLPVRRHEKASSKGSVLIESAELDRWIRCTFNRDEIPPVQMNWELLERSKQLIEELAILRREHSTLIEQSRHARLELKKSRLIIPTVGEAIHQQRRDNNGVDNGIFGEIR